MSIPSQWRPLSERLGEQPDEELYDGTPPHLLGPLATWAVDNTYEVMAQKIALRLRIDLRSAELSPRTEVALVEKVTPYPDLFLDVIDRSCS